MAGDRWVIAGNYGATTERQVWPRLTQLVVLDRPYTQLMRRCVWRTLWRGLRGERCCNGNRESIPRLLHHDGVLRYLHRTLRKRHARYATLAGEPALRHAQVVHLSSQRAIDTWLMQHAA